MTHCCVFVIIFIVFIYLLYGSIGRQSTAHHVRKVSVMAEQFHHIYMYSAIESSHRGISFCFVTRSATPITRKPNDEYVSHAVASGPHIRPHFSIDAITIHFSEDSASFLRVFVCARYLEMGFHRGICLFTDLDVACCIGKRQTEQKIWWKPIKVIQYWPRE